MAPLLPPLQRKSYDWVSEEVGTYKSLLFSHMIVDAFAKNVVWVGEEMVEDFVIKPCSGSVEELVYHSTKEGEVDKDLAVVVPFDEYKVDVLRVLGVAPTQLHPNEYLMSHKYDFAQLCRWLQAAKKKTLMMRSQQTKVPQHPLPFLRPPTLVRKRGRLLLKRTFNEKKLKEVESIQEDETSQNPIRGGSPRAKRQSKSGTNSAPSRHFSQEPFAHDWFGGVFQKSEDIIKREVVQEAKIEKLRKESEALKSETERLKFENEKLVSKAESLKLEITLSRAEIEMLKNDNFDVRKTSDELLKDLGVSRPEVNEKDAALTQEKQKTATLEEDLWKSHPADLDALAAEAKANSLLAELHETEEVIVGEHIRGFEKALRQIAILAPDLNTSSMSVDKDVKMEFLCLWRTLRGIILDL
ncbi:hypothetical protein CR513_16073, partial [Mucuna pruriens]